MVSRRARERRLSRADTGAPRAPQPTLRHRLTSRDDTGFFSCQSVLYGCMVAPVATTVLAAILHRAHLSLPGEALAVTGLAVFVLFMTYRLRRTVFAYVEVGADGVVVARRFIPYRAIKAFSTRTIPLGGEYAVLRLQDGKEAVFRIDAIAPPERAKVLERLHKEIAAHREASRGQALAALDRGDRCVSAWREALGRLLARSEGYREAPIALEDVYETLENAAAPPERRIGAAITLAGAGEPDAPARIRVAAEGCADARLRIALESIAEGEADDEAVEEALEASRRAEAHA
jgi:hypothetical protein